MRFGNVDVVPGYAFDKSVVVTDGSIREFALLCDDLNPLHHDPAYAAKTRYGEIIACGPQTLSLFAALTATHFSAFTAVVGVEFSFKFLGPVRANDRLDMRWEVTSLTPKEKRNAALAHLEGKVTTQRNETVLAGTGVLLLSDAL